MDFDKEKSLKEEVVSLTEITLSLKRRVTSLEQQYSELEIEYNSVKKLLGFSSSLLDQKRKELAVLYRI